MSAPRGPAAPGRLIAVYVTYFATIGITLPFLPQYLRSLELSGAQIGFILALNPAMALLSPTLFGHLADRTGRPDRVLTVIALGACLFFFPILFVSDFAWIALSMAAYAFFASSISTVLDSITLHRVGIVGGSYSRIRMFGSAGFVVASAAFGMAVERVDRTTVQVAFALMLTYLLASLALRAGNAPGTGRNPYAGWALLKNRDLALLLAAACLHWIACAPFHGTFSIHITDLGLQPSVVGWGAGVGVVAEIGFMYAQPRLPERIAPRHWLAISCLVSAARWAGMAFVRDPVAIVALCALHGFTFGAFFVSAVAFVARRVPPELRATGQALFVSVTFGLGGLIGYLSAGAAYDLIGGFRLFAIAAVLELIAAFMVSRARPPPGEAELAGSV